MKDKIEVNKIDIKIGDKTISLKPEQAKELKKILNEMFEESKDKVVHEHHYHDRYWWNWPVYTNPYQPYRTPYWTVVSGGTSYTGSNTGTVTNTGTVCLALNAA